MSKNVETLGVQSVGKMGTESAQSVEKIGLENVQSVNFEEIIERFPEVNALQTPEYARMNEILGCKVICSDFGGKGWAVMVVRDAKRGRYLEIPCGPICDYSDRAVAKEVLAQIAEVGAREKCVFVRIRPQIRATEENLKMLEAMGLRKSPMHLAAEHTVMLDLMRSEDEMLSDMRRQTRYEVRRAAKMGIRVEKSDTVEIFEEFQRCQAETAKRQGFVPPSLKTLMAEREAFSKKAVIYKAMTEAGEAIAYGLIICGGKEAEYYEAASTELNRKLPGAYALLWQAMRDMKAAGYERFNLWGIAPAGQTHHRYAGVTTFKTGFGGEVVEYVPAHDLVLSKMGYLKDYVVEAARKKRRHL